MAEPRWNPVAVDVVGVYTSSLTGYDAATTYKVTINGKVISSLGTGGTVTTTAAALVVLLNASTIPEFAEATWSNSSGALIATVDEAGVPITWTLTCTGGTGTVTGSVSETTSPTGLNWWSNAANWSTGAVPVSTDNIWIDTPISIKYGLGQSAVVPGSLNISAAFTDGAQIGLPDINKDATSYQEYRQKDLQIGGCSTIIGYGNGQGSDMIRLDNGSSDAVTGTLLQSQNQQQSYPNLEAIQWKGTNAANAWKIVKGSIGIAGYGGETATLASLTIGYQTSQESDANVRGGKGLTTTLLTMDGGTVRLDKSPTTITKRGGTLTVNNSVPTTLNHTGGTVYMNGTGTITNVKQGAATLDYTGSNQVAGAVTTTNCNLYSGSQILDDRKITLGNYTNTIILNQCGLDEVTLRFGSNIKITPTAGP